MYEDSYSPGLAQAKPWQDRHLNSKILGNPLIDEKRYSVNDVNALASIFIYFS